MFPLSSPPVPSLNIPPMHPHPLLLYLCLPSEEGSLPTGVHEAWHIKLMQNKLPFHPRINAGQSNLAWGMVPQTQIKYREKVLIPLLGAPQTVLATQLSHACKGPR